MTMLNHLTAFAERARRIAIQSDVPCYAIRLVNRHTGEAHQVDSAPLTVMTSDPISAANQLMRNRDPKDWDAFVSCTDRNGAIQ
ncbi:hypothetical protein PE067_07975 [Paracoccus sp. DMF-8]|uniref:hypothetical protein n=1 Tax=Paracoccus sp. DMF-8 TaxID=3019445 RepID=UPI0023E7FB46|nr:hypothetical protein [Paracoccus sp. DMF-8]MDF3606066.1 hypothetical protein [Paracoccus sp. DMF-8]